MSRPPTNGDSRRQPFPLTTAHSPIVAPYAASRQWPTGLTLTPLPTGEARLTGSVQGVDGMVAELLRWKRYVVVEGGPDLRAAMVAEIDAMAQAYQEV